MINNEDIKNMATSVLNTPINSLQGNPTLSEVLLINIMPKSLLHRTRVIRNTETLQSYKEEFLLGSFQQYLEDIKQELTLCYKKLPDSDTAESIKLETEIEAMEKIINRANVIQEVILRKISEKPSDKALLEYSKINNSKQNKSTTIENTSGTWLDIFKELCERRNEPWRRKILAEAYIQEQEISNSISLKTLWEIGLIETTTFELFIAFLSSSVYLDDDYPMVFYDHKNDDSFMHEYVEVDDLRETTLFQIINHLEEYGLIMHGSVLFNSNEKINGFSKNHNFYIEHTPQIKDSTGSELKFTGYHCTDLGLDIYRVCSDMVNLNTLSDNNYEELKELLSKYQETITIIEVIE